uniref:Uncharacterized protein n=1 Tax=Leersia perrieri TaxID=77586 RepID=A0A0D9XTR7_9ORYZ
MEPSDFKAPVFTFNYWMKEVRELSYDIDDFADELLFHAAANAASSDKPSLKAFLCKIQQKLSRRRVIVDEVSGFRVRLEELIQMYKNYQLGSLERCPGWQTNGILSLNPSLAEETKSLGMDRDMDKLAGLVANDDDQLECKIISIVGPGGIGKTTLADKLYHKFGCQFDCHAFVRLSRKTDMKRILTSLLLQVRQHESVGAVDVNNLAYEINSYLKDKRYFIVIDDLWSLSTWDTINCALPKSSCSIILVTTEVELLAQICSANNSKYIFEKEPFDEDETNQLLFTRVCESKSVELFKEFSSLIAHLCSGLPLIISVTASILARLPPSIEQWNLVNVSLSYGLEGILNLVYSTLPNRLKACLLYLGIYEEDFIILKDDLLNQWIEEGFIGRADGIDQEITALIYFDELISSGLIQPVATRFDNEVLSCRIHYMILDFIRHKSIENNFGIAIDNCQADVRVASKIRRLSLHFSSAKDATIPVGLRCSQVRTLVYFGPIHYTPSIAEFRVIRVLILQLSNDLDDITYDLTEIAKLFGLKYVHINACNLNIKLPTQIRQLKHLARFNIEARLRDVSSDIINCPRLVQLLLPSDTTLPHCIEQMRSLQTLGHFDLSSSSTDNILSLGKLINLQNLYMTFSKGQLDNLNNKIRCLGLILDKLRNMKSLTLVVAGSHVDSSTMVISCDDFNVTTPPILLKRFEFSWRAFIFSYLPKWIKELANLNILKIAISEMSRADADVLSGLPALISLSLYIQRAPEEKITLVKEDSQACEVLKAQVQYALDEI